MDHREITDGPLHGTAKWLPRSVYLSDMERSLSASCDAPTSGSYKSKSTPFDLCTRDLPVVAADRVDRSTLAVTLQGTNLSSLFRGFSDSRPGVMFVLKSSLTQLGINCDSNEAQVTVEQQSFSATVKAILRAISPLGVLTLDYITTGCLIGKLFAEDAKRKVRVMSYLERLTTKKDMWGKAILVCGAKPEENWDLKEVDGRIVAYLPVKPGVIRYKSEVHGLLPTVGLSLKAGRNYKELLRLHTEELPERTRLGQPHEVLMVRSASLQLRTMFGRVCNELLPKGLRCASSCIIEPHSGEIDDADVHQGRTFVFVGESTEEITHIPIEFYTLECYREHVAFETRKTLAKRALNAEDMIKAFATLPQDNNHHASVFICKGSIFDRIQTSDWVVSLAQKTPDYQEIKDPEQRQEQITRYLHQQPEYTILSALALGDITSDGVLLSRYFPSPVMKSLLLSRGVAKHLRAIYFLRASYTHGNFFSQEDKAMMIDLQRFGISVFHVDVEKREMFQFQERFGTDSGMMLPLSRKHEFLNATFFGVYGSNLVAGNFEDELNSLMQRILALRQEVRHPMLNGGKPIALVTGGGPGAMEVGNRVAKSLGILSCGMFVDFGAMAKKPGATINEQKQNPYVEAYMPYRPEKLVERQSDFQLDFPIFLMGGIGTDFEYALEEVRRKVGVMAIHPMILFGTKEHFANKIGHRWRENVKCGTVKGSEWLSNIPYVVRNASEAFAVYKRFFTGTLAIGPDHPSNDDGFVVVDEAFVEAANKLADAKL